MHVDPYTLLMHQTVLIYDIYMCKKTICYVINYKMNKMRTYFKNVKDKVSFIIRLLVFYGFIVIRVYAV